jgi:hypothetical protein
VTYVLARNGVDNIIRRGTQKLGDDGELVDVILAGEEGLAVKHLSKDAAGTPDINLDVVFLPGEHDLGGSVISRRNVSGHLRVLDAGESEVANLQIAVFVYKNIARLQVTVNHASRVHIFQAALQSLSALAAFPSTSSGPYHDLVQKVLNKLLLEWSRR